MNNMLNLGLDVNHLTNNKHNIINNKDPVYQNKLKSRKEE